MFDKDDHISGKRRPWFFRLNRRRWLPLFILPVAACLGAPDTSPSITASTQQAFTGRDVPSSQASTPNGQYTWTPTVNGTPHEHIAVSPDGAFYLHAEGKSDAQLYASPLALDDAMVTADSVNFANFGANGAIALNPSRASSISTNKYKLGGLGAVSFNPRHGIGPFRVGSAANCPATAGTVALVAVPNGSHDCYRMLVYAQVRDATSSSVAYHHAIAPLHVAIDRETHTIASAAFDAPFNRISQSNGTYLNARSNDNDQFSDHFTATADGRLIVFDTRPYYSWSPDPEGLSNFDAPASFWSVTDPVRSRSVRLGAPPNATQCSSGDLECVRFDQAYPVFRAPFQFADNTPIATDRGGCGYPWITPDGTDLFCNAGDISALAMLGQSTHGTLQHVDAQVQTTQQRFCEETTAGKSCKILPPDGALGTTACSPRGSNICGGDPATTLGTQRITSIATATGPWKARTATGADTGRFPLMHRAPSLLMMSRNTALPAFGNDAAKGGSFLYFEVATDAGVDPNFVAFFHMNEAIMPIASGTAASTWKSEAPFGDTNPAGGIRAKYTADAGGFGYTGMLNAAAKFPFDRFDRIELPSTRPPNPGFIGRAIYFQMPSGKVDFDAADTAPLRAQRSTMTLELAVQPKAFDANTGKTVLVAAPGSYELSFNPSTQSVTFATTGATSPATFASVTIPNDAYTHLALTYEGGTATTPATVKLYRNGLYINAATIAGSTALPAIPASTKPLCVGPGCCLSDCASATTPELLIDEVGISSVVRSNEYIAGVAAVDGPTDVFAPGEPLSWYSSLPLGLQSSELRIPRALMNEVRNELNPQQKFARIAAIGKALFVDDVLAVNANACGGRVPARSCATCHDPANYFAHQGENLDQGIDDSELDTNTPSLLGRAFSTRQLKDRSEASLLHQANRVIENPIEMGGSLPKIVSCLNRTTSPESIPAGYAPAGVTTYRQWFNYAFAGSTSTNNAVTKDQILAAIAAYEITLISGGSAVDQMLTNGSGSGTLMSEGARIFQGKGRCAGCHSGSNFTDELTHVTSVNGTAIKTPSLRNVMHTNPHFHKGEKPNLRSVVEHYNCCGAVNPDGTCTSGACAPELVALGLTGPEINALVAFLEGLSSPAPAQ